jgi:hypothetical protein
MKLLLLLLQAWGVGEGSEVRGEGNGGASVRAARRILTPPGGRAWHACAAGGGGDGNATS